MDANGEQLQLGVAAHEGFGGFLVEGFLVVFEFVDVAAAQAEEEVGFVAG